VISSIGFGGGVVAIVKPIHWCYLMFFGGDKNFEVLAIKEKIGFILH
jgi:hypothetical protein